MHFAVLEQFNDFEVADLKLMDAILFLIYRSGNHERFSPRIYRQFGLSVDERKWTLLLARLETLGFIQSVFELKCPDCSKTITSYYSYDEIPLNQPTTCSNCGRKFTITEREISIMYNFTDRFKPSCIREDNQEC